MGIVVDTSELVHIERTMNDPGGLAGRLPLDSAVSAITLAELLVGAHLADSEPRRILRTQFVERLLDFAPLIPFGEREAQEHARLFVHLRRAGTMIGERDLQIAATAIAGGHQVLTRNTSEFARVPGLQLLQIPGA